MKHDALHSRLSGNPRRDGFSMSLRSRIALSYTIATAVMLFMVLTLIFFMVERIVYSHFDEELDRDVSEILAESSAERVDFGSLDISGNKHGKDDRREHRRDGDPDEQDEDDADKFLQLAGPEGAVLSKSANLGTDSLTFQTGSAGKIYRNSTVGKAAVRQIQVPVTGRNGSPEGYILAAVPVRDAVVILGDLKQVLLLSFPLIILTLFVLTRLIAGRSIRPVEQVIAAAEKITRASLDERIPLPRHRDELYRLSVTFNDLLERLQEAFQREKQFTADASHELKTPLASVKGTLEVLIRKPREREHYEERIQICLKELNRMAMLIDQLLMLARYESSGMNASMEPLDLCTSIGEVVRRMHSRAEQKRISIIFDCHDRHRVSADPAMLDMIVGNLLSNALKYSPPDSFIGISVSRNNGGIVSCRITDNGMGIPEEKLGEIFERFYRVDESRSSGTGGFGLGLAIVKKLADLQQITVTVTSRSGSGTTVELQFPRHEKF